MSRIHELDEITIDQIAAGEVVDRPSSIVKELVENAVDAGSTTITVEIKEGGISLIRVTDNGSGMEPEDVKIAFHRHATSKIRTIEDLNSLHTLGFRGEALSSIAAVAQVELLTKTKDSLSGTRYLIEGGKEGTLEEVGAPQGTSILVRNLFFNTPARRKFLKKPQTEFGYIADLMEHLALDNPTVSFRFISNGTDKFHTSGNGDLKEVIYRIYGRDVSMNLVPIRKEQGDMILEGYLGTPALNRSNRNHEHVFVNGRYIRDKVIGYALEEGYRPYLMQHKFPFAVLHLSLNPESVDVNVHPSKMEMRFHRQQLLVDFIIQAVDETLHRHEMMPDALMSEMEEVPEKPAPQPEPEKPAPQPKRAPEPFEWKRIERQQETTPEEPVYATGVTPQPIRIADENKATLWNHIVTGEPPKQETKTVIKASEQVIVERPQQMELFDDKLLSKAHKDEYHIIGQIFDTYWILTLKDKMFLVDQHAAHEKVNYERMLKKYHDHEMMSQNLEPPVVMSFTAKEAAVFEEYQDYFAALGFVVEEFGAHAYAMRAVPLDLFGCDDEKEMFVSILDELCAESANARSQNRDPEVITSKIASMACKASVKGNMSMNGMEMKALLEELLTLDNPYNCPHGRPTIITMSKYEIDRKFKRIVT